MHSINISQALEESLPQSRTAKTTIASPGVILVSVNSIPASHPSCGYSKNINDHLG
jgi:hypothetical protein